LRPPLFARSTLLFVFCANMHVLPPLTRRPTDRPAHWCYSINIVPRSSTVKVELKTIQLQGISYEDLMLASLLDSLANAPAPNAVASPGIRLP
jgi:hypothetical protein